MNVGITGYHQKQQNATIHVPEIMHAAAIDAFGGPEMLTFKQVPVPKMEKGEVLIALDTAGVGSWDAEMRAGWYPDGHPDFPLVLGTDGSGIVVNGVLVTKAVVNVPGGGNTRTVRRPNVVAGVDPILSNNGLAYINPAAFSVPAPGTFGNSGRNSLAGPPLAQ